MDEISATESQRVGVAWSYDNQPGVSHCNNTKAAWMCSTWNTQNGVPRQTLDLLCSAKGPQEGVCYMYSSASMWQGDQETPHQSLRSDTNLAFAALWLFLKLACTQGSTLPVIVKSWHDTLKQTWQVIREIIYETNVRGNFDLPCRVWPVVDSNALYPSFITICICWRGQLKSLTANKEYLGVATKKQKLFSINFIENVKTQSLCCPSPMVSLCTWQFPTLTVTKAWTCISFPAGSLSKTRLPCTTTYDRIQLFVTKVTSKLKWLLWCEGSERVHRPGKSQPPPK